jgi:hypothetical protein
MLGTTVRDFPPVMIYPSIGSLTNLDLWKIWKRKENLNIYNFNICKK